MQAETVERRVTMGEPRARGNAGLFRATWFELKSEADRDAVDRTAALVRALFAADLDARPSRHVYVDRLPPELVSPIDHLRSLPAIEDGIRAQYGEEVDVTPLRETDELYLCHHNADHGGDHGLFAKHYDGNLRALPGAVVRALVYVASEGDYRVVFGDSGVSRALRTYEVALLDFHRELHWVEGRYEKGMPDRILLKCNYLVVPRRQRALAAPLRALNLGQFYVVKAAMEYSKSPRTPAQRLVGLVCNAVRALNNVHPLLPHVAMVATLGAAIALGIALVTRAF